MKPEDVKKLTHYLSTKTERFWVNVAYIQIVNFMASNKTFYYDLEKPTSRKSKKFNYLTSVSFYCNAATETPNGFVYYYGKVQYKRVNKKHIVTFTPEKEAAE